MNARTTVAKAIFWCANQLSRIRTPRLTYRLSWTDQSESPTREDPRWYWLPCQTSIRLMNLSIRIDPDHFDHWTAHPGCDGEPCAACGGVHCPHEEWDDEEAA